MSKGYNPWTLELQQQFAMVLQRAFGYAAH
jgi:hypothetical protein